MADSAERVSARGRLTQMVAASVRPTLDQAALDLLLDGARIPDTTGLNPVDSGYTETFDLNWAAAEGWRWKAGQVASDYSFTADDASYSRGDVLANMERMVAMYAAKCHGHAVIANVTDQRTYDWSELIP